MPKCKFCGKKGFFLSLSSNDLCNKCNPIVVSKITGSARIIQDCLNLVDDSKKLDVRLGRRKLLLEHAEILLEFENKNINTIEPLPSELIDEYAPLHDKIVVEVTETDLTNILAKAKKAVTEKTKVKYVKKAINKLNYAKKLIENKTELFVLEDRIHSFVDSENLKTALEKQPTKAVKTNDRNLEKKIEKLTEPKLIDLYENKKNINNESHISEIKKHINVISKKVKNANITDKMIEDITGYKINNIVELLNITKEVALQSLNGFASTYMNTSRSMLSQKVSDLSAENYKEEGGVVYWEYFGALPDEKTRDECLTGLGVQPSASYPNAPFFTDDEKMGFQSEFGIRWSCRHEFNQITEDYYEEMTGNSTDE
ncbi:MAG: hypothetical protein HN952_07540 [Candidatus Cloacimonetes bacterium]|jgi:hypothetical protein|nr:hypothetical protein [Candidatus Cloacimonadota bacterium]